MEERRKFVRIKALQEVDVRIKNDNGIFKSVDVKDMSLSGINFYSESFLEKGFELNIKINLPDGFGSVALSGMVLWQLSGINNKLATGVRFHHKDDKIKELLSKFIHEHAKNVDESRKFIRCNLKTEILVQDLLNPDENIPARTVDISNRGMKLVLAKKVETGTKLNLTIFLPDDKEAFKFQVRVVWVRKEVGEEGFAVGIIYAELKSADKDRICKFITDFCKFNQRRI